MILQDKHSKKINIIFGPPGTGKTTHLLNIVEKELQQGTPPDRIGYFAFTNKAADEAIARASIKFGLDKKDLKYFRTLHSMAFKFLGLKNADVMGDKDYKELSDYLQVNIINPNKTVKDLGISQPQDPYLKIIDTAKVKNISLSAAFLQSDEHIRGGFEFLSYIDRGIEDFKKRKNVLNFTDMILKFNERKDAPKLDVAIIDEAQDLSFIQWQMVELIIRNCERAYVAGDDDQAIFDWAGADTKRLGLIGGERTVLQQSYRIPKSIHRLANNLITKVRDRVPKDWQPKDREGLVKHHRTCFNPSIDLTNGSWLILARTNYIAEQFIEDLKSKGFFYEYKGRSSVSDKMMNAIKGWKKIQQGESVELPIVKDIYHYISGNSGIERGFKNLENASDEVTYDYESLVVKHGLNVDSNTEWNFALDKIPAEQTRYINSAMDRDQDFHKSKNIKISTIHASKGGEADNVMLLKDLPTKVDNNISKVIDDERRVFYVGATRAKKSLHLISSKSNREFKEL
jgi:DNA helicase-2/ATP-dependent DNA helicase PcrA